MSYWRVARGSDELMPLSQRGSNLIGNSGATIIDSLDTLYIMGLHDEYILARSWVQDSYHPQQTSGYVSVFETTIRELGGLLAIYDLTGDLMFIEKAKQLGDIVLSAFGDGDLPASTYEPHTRSMGSVHDLCIAEVGSITVELERLGVIIGDTKYHHKIDRLLLLISKRKGGAQNARWDGLFPMDLNAKGVFRSSSVSLGGRSDSFYEYLIKLHILRNDGNRRTSVELKLFQDSVNGMMMHLVGRYGPNDSGYYMGEWNMHKNVLDNQMEHLTCFVPGMFVMGLQRKLLDSVIQGHDVLRVAEGLGEACWQMYATSSTGLAGENTRFDSRGAHPVPGRRFYIQRPEAVESFWYLFRFTGDSKWQTYGTRIFKAIESNCAVHNGEWGYSGLLDDGNQDDKQQSFFIAETLKYLYFLHSPTPAAGENDFMDSTKWILNTEAHPLKVGLGYYSTNDIPENRPASVEQTPPDTTSTALAEQDPSSVSIAVAIPTHNRPGYVQLCADALRGTVKPEDIWIFDDASDAYSASTLRNWFGTQNIQRFDDRKKADLMGRTILEWFAEHKTVRYDWVVTLDSDLIVNPEWLRHLRNALSKTDGVISLYHSGNMVNHPVIQCAAGLCTLASLGNAGVVWRMDTARRMLNDVTNRASMYDWGWSNWCKTHGIRLMAFEKSLVVHVGMHGTWGAETVQEKAVEFDMNKLSPQLRHRVDQYIHGHKPPI